MNPGHLREMRGCYPSHHQVFAMKRSINLVYYVLNCFDTYFRGGIIVPPPEPLGTKKYVEPLRVKSQIARHANSKSTDSAGCSLQLDRNDGMP